MSWLFSQALVAEFSAQNCSDGEQSAQLSVMPTPHKFWRNDKMMEHSKLSQFGLTCAVLTEDIGRELLTWFLAVFRARTSALRGGVRESTANDPGYGMNLPGSFARFCHVTCSWKTPQLSLLEDLDEYSETWPQSGTMRNGVCWERTTSARGTSATASGLLPTLTVHGNYNRKGVSANSGDGLATAIRRLPTLLARDWRSGKASATTIAKNSRPLSETIGGTLNPAWCEWFMGWPIGWTASEPLAMDRFQQWLDSHGISSAQE